MSTVRKTAESEPANIDKLAEHFDLVDAGDLPWEEATDLEIARPELEQISLRLPKEDLADLRTRAAKLGVGYTTLIRMILHQHLRNPLAR